MTTSPPKKGFIPKTGKPVISYFGSDVEEIMANEEVILEWLIDNARKIRLDGIEMINGNYYKVLIDSNKSFELTASNWFGKDSAYYEVRLYTPVITVFESQELFITEEQPVKVHFRVKYALQWKLEVTYNDIGSGRNKTLAEGNIENGYIDFEHSIEVLLNGACTLKLVTSNGQVKGIPETIRLGTRPLSVELSSDPSVAKSGSTVLVRWRVQNTNKLILNPGNIDVTGLTQYDFIAQGNRDIQLELIAYGDFGQQRSDARMLYLARIDKLEPANNGNPDFPQFYLSWSAYGLQQLKLLPDNIPVRETEKNFNITPEPEAKTYTLSGRLYNGEEVQESRTLVLCSLKKNLKLVNGFAIIGTMAVLQWETAQARRIQLRFSNDIELIEFPPDATEYPFQVVESMEKVTLYVWGDLNLIQTEIPIPRFISPTIKQLIAPVLHLQLGIHWMPSPIPKSSRQVHQLFSLAQGASRRSSAFYWRLFRFLSTPSEKLLVIVQKFRRQSWQIHQYLLRSVYKILNVLSSFTRTLLWEIKQQLIRFKKGS